MEDAQHVRRGQAVRNLDAGRKRQLQVCRAFGDDLVERLARDVLHDDVRFGIVAFFFRRLAHVVDGTHVGVIDGGGQPGFPQLRGAHLVEGEKAALQKLQHHGPLQQRILREKNNARTAGAYPADEFVVADDAALHRSIIASRVVGV